MSDADDKLDFCKQALGEIGTRSTITSLDPPDGSPEAFYCNLFFNGTRDQLLRAAHWNFAGRTDTLILWKALPGTPENPITSPNYQWSNRDPAPPWLYSYLYSPFVLQIRRIHGQDLQNSDFQSPSFFGGPTINYSQSHYPTKFEVSSDRYDPSGTPPSLTVTMSVVTIVTGGSGYQPADRINLTGGVYGIAPTVQVSVVDTNGSVVTATIVYGGSFTVPPTGSLTQLSTTGRGTGFTCTGGFVQGDPIPRVILTNARNAIVDYTTSDVEVAQYDASFGDAFMAALGGKLALALIGDKALYQAKLQEANAAIIDARVRDGNEGLTQYDHVPDWLAVRGVASMGPSSQWFNPPYGPLFAV